MCMHFSWVFHSLSLDEVFLFLMLFYLCFARLGAGKKCVCLGSSHSPTLFRFRFAVFSFVQSFSVAFLRCSSISVNLLFSAFLFTESVALTTMALQPGFGLFNSRRPFVAYHWNCNTASAASCFLDNLSKVALAVALLLINYYTETMQTLLCHPEFGVIVHQSLGDQGGLFLFL